jgi:hypothetical protein
MSSLFSKVLPNNTLTLWELLIIKLFALAFLLLSKSNNYLLTQRAEVKIHSLSINDPPHVFSSEMTTVCHGNWLFALPLGFFEILSFFFEAK